MNSGFVTARNGHLVLNGQQWRWVGPNAYWLLDTKIYGNEGPTLAALTACRQRGWGAMRTWAFADGKPEYIQPNPGEFNETAAQHLDWVVAQAATAGVRLMLALTGGPVGYGGSVWYAQRAGVPHDQFWGNAQCKAWYKTWVSELLNRVNIYTGKRYKDEPMIAAWELVNELDAETEQTSGAVIDAWVREMSAYVKSIDPNHLVAHGMSGFDVTAAPYPRMTPYTKPWYFNGRFGTAWQLAASDPNVDLLGIHCYPDSWGQPAEMATAWVLDHRDIAAAIGKPFYIGEIGFVAAGNGTPDDPTPFRQIAQLIQAGIDGAFVWQLLVPGSWGDAQYYGFAADSRVAAELSNAAALATAPEPEPPPDLTPRVAALEARVADLVALLKTAK